MAIQKQRKKRIWEEIDFIQNPRDMQQHIGRLIYLLIDSETMIGSTRLADMNEYMARENILEVCSNDPSELTLLYGIVLNVKSLPMELPDGLPSEYELFVVRMDDYNTPEYELVTGIDDAIEYIECGVADSNGISDIDDFGVLFGIELTFKLQIVPNIMPAHTAARLCNHIGV